MPRSEAAPKRPPLKERYQALLAEYGSLALYLYLAIFVVVLFGFAVAIQLGADVDSATGTASILGAAYVATKLTQPIRIGATLVLTPVVVRFVRKAKNKQPLDPRGGRAPRQM